MITKQLSVSVLGFACLFSLSSSQEDAPDLIPYNTTSLGNSRFVIYRQEIGWIEARDICKKRDGRLAVLPNRKDAESLVDEIRYISTPYSEDQDEPTFVQPEYVMSRRYWIGLSDLIKEGEWEWVHDSGNTQIKLDYKYWYPGQPDIPGEHCVVLWNPAYHLHDIHTFNDEDCSNKHYFICEETTIHQESSEVADKTKIGGRSLGRKNKPNLPITVKPPGRTRKKKKQYVPQPSTEEDEYTPGSIIVLPGRIKEFRNKKPEITPAITTIPETEKPRTKLFISNAAAVQKREAEADSEVSDILTPSLATSWANDTLTPLSVNDTLTPLSVNDTLTPLSTNDTLTPLSVNDTPTPSPSPVEREASDNENELIPLADKDEYSVGNGTEGSDSLPIDEGPADPPTQDPEMGDLMKSIKNLSPSERDEILAYLKGKMGKTTTPDPTLLQNDDKPIAAIGLKELLVLKLQNKSQDEN